MIWRLGVWRTLSWWIRQISNEALDIPHHLKAHTDNLVLQSAICNEECLTRQ